MNLYELSESYNNVLQLAEQLDEETFLDTLEAINDSIELKAENIAKICRDLESNASRLKDEANTLADKSKRLKANSQRLKHYLEENMIKTNKRKFKTALFSFSIQNNPPSVDITNLEEIPLVYRVIQEPKIDKKAILQDLKNGIEVKGAQIKQTEGLRIR